MATTEEEKPAEQAKEVSTKEVEAEKPAMSEDEAVAGVTERLKFFFSDANVRQDNFIRHKLMSDDKCVPISDLLKFNTIKQYTLDSEVVKKAAEKLTDSLVVKDDAIARVNEFTKDLMDKNIPVTLVISNLPTEEKEGRVKYTATNDELKEMFEGYGTVVLTKFRFGFAQSPDEDVMGFSPGKRRPKSPRVPIGSALVEFETIEAFDKAVEDTLTTKEGASVEPKRKLKLGENELTVVTLKDYIDSRKKRKAERKDDRDEKEEEEEAELPTYKVDWKPGCVIKLDGLARACDREKMLEAIAEGLGKDVEGVKEMQIYVDFSRGQTDGCIRFLEPEQVPDILKKLQSGELHIAGEKVESAILLEGDAEKQYWQDFMDFKTKQMRQREEERRSRGGGRRKKFRRSNK
eukprot:scaffold3240_cov187-Amphora_coffeaeformis.AAC.4